MASLSGQTLAKIGVPYYLPIGSFDPSGAPMILSPLVVSGNPYDAYLTASSNVRLLASSNGVPQASLTMTSNVSVSIPGMTCNILELESNLATFNSTVRFNTLANLAFLQIGPEDANTSYITNVGSAAPGGSNSFLAFNNDGRLFVNGGLVVRPTSFYAESAGPSRVITTGNQITFATGAGDTPVTSLSRTGTTFLLSNAGVLQFVSSNLVLDQLSVTYTASNGFGLSLNPGFAGTSNILGLTLPGGNTSNNIVATSNSMAFNVGGSAALLLNASQEILQSPLNPGTLQTRTPSVTSFQIGTQSWGFGAAAAPTSQFTGFYSNTIASGNWITVSPAGAVDFPGGFTVSNISTPTTSSNSIGGVTLSNTSIIGVSTSSNTIGGVTLSNGTISNTAPSSIAGVSLSNSNISNALATINSIGGVALNGGFSRPSSNVWDGYTDSNLRIINRVYVANPPNVINNLLGYPSIDPQTYNSNLYSNFTWFKLWFPSEIVVDTSGPCQLFFTITSKVQSPTPGNGNTLWLSNIGGGGGQIVRWGAINTWQFPTSNLNGTNSTYAFATQQPILVHKDVFPIFVNGYIADPPNAQANYRVYNGSVGANTSTSPIGDLPIMLEGWF